MKKVIKHVFSNLIFSILKNCMNDLPFLPKRMETEKFEKLVALIYMKQLNMLYIYKKFEISIKSWISFEKRAQSD